jgi:hypothetical protein
MSPSPTRPMLPCFRDAFGALEERTTHGERPPASRRVPRHPSTDLVNSCTL